VNGKDRNTPKKKDNISFHSIINDVSLNSVNQQKDASFPFYFICLLHLANEKV
jgi:hypothetical protein